jgi:hypothetical protein
LILALPVNGFGCGLELDEANAGHSMRRDEYATAPRDLHERAILFDQLGV